MLKLEMDGEECDVYCDMYHVYVYVNVNVYVLVPLCFCMHPSRIWNLQSAHFRPGISISARHLRRRKLS